MEYASEGLVFGVIGTIYDDDIKYLSVILLYKSCPILVYELHSWIVETTCHLAKILSSDVSDPRIDIAYDDLF